MVVKVMIPMGTLPSGGRVECLSTWVSSSGKDDDDEPNQSGEIGKAQPQLKSNLYL